MSASPDEQGWPVNPLLLLEIEPCPVDHEAALWLGDEPRIGVPFAAGEEGERERDVNVAPDVELLAQHAVWAAETIERMRAAIVDLQHEIAILKGGAR